LILLGTASGASALPILSIVSPTANAVVGDAVNVDVLVSNLDNEFIGAYDVSLSWNSLLSLTAVTFDAFLDGPADSISGWDAIAGGVNVFEVSLAALVNQTGIDDFRLFSLTFATLTSGAGFVTWAADAHPLLSNEVGEALGFENPGEGVSFTITPPPVSVPEPPSLTLLSFGLVAMLTALLRRRGGSDFRAAAWR
jgi:hypothetical protein